MSKCVYCSKEIADPKFTSLIYPQKYVCEGCVPEEDTSWFTLKNIDKYPDFTNEIKEYLKSLDGITAKL